MAANRRSRLLLTAAPLVMLSVIVAAVGLSRSPQIGHSTDALPGTDQPVTFTTESPSEAPPKDDYAVSAGNPWRIEVAGRGVAGYIQRVGVDQKRSVAAPDNVHMAGWFIDSAKPGQPGLSIIDGHVDGMTRPGIFHDLSRLIKGDKITVTYGDKKQYIFTVFETRTVAAAEANNHLFSQDRNVGSQLNLITCGGAYDRGQGTYDKRIIVSARLEG